MAPLANNKKDRGDDQIRFQRSSGDVTGLGWWGGEGGGEIFTARRVSASIAVASRVPSSTLMEGGQSGNEDGGNNDCASERVRGRNQVRELKP